MKKTLQVVGMLLMVGCATTMYREYIQMIRPPAGWQETDTPAAMPYRVAQSSRMFQDGRGGEMMIFLGHAALPYEKGRQEQIELTRKAVEQMGAYGFEPKTFPVEASGTAPPQRSWASDFLVGVGGEPRTGETEAWLSRDGFGGWLEYMMVLTYPPAAAQRYDAEALGRHLFGP